MLKDVVTAPMSGAEFPDGTLKMEYSSSFGDSFRDWALLLPPKNSDIWVTYLHGSLSHADQVFTRQDIRAQILPRIQRNGWGLLAPNLRNNPRMAPSAVHDLHELIGYLRREFSLKRNYLNGGSMGGTGGIIFCMMHPEDVDKAFLMGASPDIISYYRWIEQDPRPIFAALRLDMVNAWGGTPETVPEVYDRQCVLRHPARLKVPLFLSHAADDNMIPVRYARELAAKKAGDPDFIYHELPSGGHDAPLFDQDGYRFLYGE